MAKRGGGDRIRRRPRKVFPGAAFHWGAFALFMLVVAREASGTGDDATLRNIFKGAIAASKKSIPSDPMPMLAGVVSGTCGELAIASVGEYRAKDGAVVKVPATPPPDLKLIWASITKTLGAMLIQVAIKEGYDVTWNDKISKFLPHVESTQFKDVTILAVASHTACLDTEFWVPTDAQFANFKEKYKDIFSENLLAL